MLCVFSKGTVVNQVGSEPTVNFGHSSSSPMKYEEDALYPHFFSTFQGRLSFRTLWLVFETAELNSSQGTVSDLEHLEDTVLLSDRVYVRIT